ncbi:2-keto-4-pentenoate hydratase [Dactylosporangium cerinum]|uniref:2-keto-4-pentenoate hydratase n=1 Tax=Dactylosporangium cerinum TaxID=1434730 RepID=A0ABV9W4K2_9ACTN
MTSPAAQRLLDAARTATPCAPVRDLIGAQDVGAAYAVQREITLNRQSLGARTVGHKIGLTSAAVQRQLGVDQPDFGVLFDDMDVSALDPVPVGGLLQPRIEAEVAFLLRADLTGDLSAAAVRAAVDVMVPALEIVDSRIAGWDISIADTIADNASSGLFVLGDDRVGLDALEPVDIQMELSVDGAVVSKGAGSACLGDPLAALAWLAAAARDLGDPLLAGQVVLSGALGPMVPVLPGMRVTAAFTGLGTVTTRFGTE